MKALRILLVEDDANIRAALAETLESMGHSVCATAATERDAVTEALRSMPDLMIVDIELAPGSGLAAVAQILQGGHVPHFFISGVHLGAMANGVPGLRKPFREPDLVRSIDAALRVSQAKLGPMPEVLPDPLPNK